MISHRDIVEILPAEDSTPKDIKLVRFTRSTRIPSHTRRESGAFITIEVTASMATGTSKTGMPCLARTSAICVTAAPISTQEWMTSFQELSERDRPREVPADSVPYQRCDGCN
jgi:hypothetical protein